MKLPRRGKKETECEMRAATRAAPTFALTARSGRYPAFSSGATLKITWKGMQ